MRTLSITVLFLLTATLSYCQNVYPRIALIDDDAVILITGEQVQKMNEVFDERDFYREKVDSLSLEFKFQKELLDRHLSINSKLVQKNTELFVELDGYKEKDRINNELKGYYIREVNQQKSKGIKLAIGGVTIGVTAGVLLTLLLSK